MREIKYKYKIKICPICKKEFQCLKDCKSNNQIFCSLFCANEAKRNGKPNTKKCKQCLKIFSISPSEMKSKFFCSKECYSKWRKRQTERTELVCAYCKKHFKRSKKRVEQYNYKKHFCSKKCSQEYHGKHIYEWRNNSKGENNPSWKGGISKEPYNFDFDEELKKLIRKRDNYKCQICGNFQKECIQKLSIHHIDYNKKNSNPDNLISLCKKCHHKTNYRRDYWINYFQIAK